MQELQRPSVFVDGDRLDRKQFKEESNEEESLRTFDLIVDLLKTKPGLQQYEIVKKLGYTRSTRSTPVNSISFHYARGELIRFGGRYYLPNQVGIDGKPLTIKCSWCSKILFDGSEEISHGICEKCRDKHFPEEDDI